MHKPPKGSLTLRFFGGNPLWIYFFPACHLPGLFNPPWSDHLSIIWLVVILQLLTMQLFLISRYFLFLSTKYLPQHSVFKHPLPMFFAQCERPGYTAVWTTGKDIVLYIHKESIPSCCTVLFIGWLVLWHILAWLTRSSSGRLLLCVRHLVQLNY